MYTSLIPRPLRSTSTAMLISASVLLTLVFVWAAQATPAEAAISGGYIAPETNSDAAPGGVDVNYIVQFDTDVTAAAASTTITFPAGYTITDGDIATSTGICTGACGAGQFGLITVGSASTTVASVTGNAAARTITVLLDTPTDLSDGSGVSFYLKEGITNPAAGGLTGNFTIMTDAAGESSQLTSGVMIAPTKATTPSPANASTSVRLDPTLTFASSTGAARFDVYFGTDSSPDATEYQGTQTSLSFSPGALSGTTTYYWRIDSANSGGTTTGDVWEFKTGDAPGLPTTPAPANASTSVATTTTIGWAVGANTTHVGVFFGTDTTPDESEFQVRQAAGTTSYDPAGDLAHSTTYYWRIDGVNSAGTTTGTVWSFTTYGPPTAASSPSPADAATSQSVSVDLAWTAGSAATTRGVYFGTDSSPDETEYKGNQAGVAYDPGTLVSGTTYYWRIDEANSAGTTTGTVWSFTTAAAASGGGSSSSRRNRTTSTQTPSTAGPKLITAERLQQLIGQFQSTVNAARANPTPTTAGPKLITAERLQQLMAAFRGQTTPSPSVPTLATFTRDLTVGSSGEDVRSLQRWLNARGFSVAASGPGSTGNETTLFGAATRAALMKYQVSKGITPATGYLGPKTRASMSGI